jgi:hypothetical protein
MTAFMTPIMNVPEGEFVLNGLLAPKQHILAMVILAMGCCQDIHYVDLGMHTLLKLAESSFLSYLLGDAHIHA